jgi:hypothetical protein
MMDSPTLILTHEYLWYSTRLADPGLLDLAVVIPLKNGVRMFAVPVGGSRRGGHVLLAYTHQARIVCKFLTGRPGFPNPRLELTDEPGMCQVVLWGDPEPTLPDRDAEWEVWREYEREKGRYYGYREDQIEAFVERRYPGG